VLAVQVRDILAGNGFTEYRYPDPPHGPAFAVTPGVSVSVAWMDASPEQRASMLDDMHAVLTEAGLDGERRANSLYLPEAAWMSTGF
jgi:hypothetical protein